jgi:hypothetical protein
VLDALHCIVLQRPCLGLALLSWNTVAMWMLYCTASHCTALHLYCTVLRCAGLHCTCHFVRFMVQDATQGAAPNTLYFGDSSGDSKKGREVAEPSSARLEEIAEMSHEIRKMSSQDLRDAKSRHGVSWVTRSPWSGVLAAHSCCCVAASSLLGFSLACA